MKLVMMRGLPASGKTTAAKEILLNGGNFIRLNKDLLREMLHFSKFTGKNEGATVFLEEALAIAAMKSGKNVVVDDTNLGETHKARWERVAGMVGATFEARTMDTDYRECITRDLHREKKVGSHVIYQMAMQYGLIGLPPAKHGLVKNGEYVICDIDGTLAEISHRLCFLEGDSKDWKGFFSRVDKDTFRQEVWDQVVAEGKKVILVSARPEEYRDQTVEWLADNSVWEGLQFETLIMRRSGDRRDDTIVKKEILDRYFKFFNVTKVFDDRPRVIQMWRDNGLDVVDVGAGVDF